MRDWKNYSTEELIRRVFIHGYVMCYQGMPLEMDESVASVIAEIKKRIEKGGDAEK
jgi:hypothetical protein